MKIRSLRLIPVLPVLLFEACDKPEVTQAAPPPPLPPRTEKHPVELPPDPVALLQAHLRTPNPYPDKAWANPKYDVKKTDSLVSPFQGIIETRIGEMRDKDFVLYQVDLAFTDGKWRIANLQASNGWGMETYTPDHDPKQWYEWFQRRFRF